MNSELPPEQIYDVNSSFCDFHLLLEFCNVNHLGNMISAEAYFIRKDDIRSQEVDERDRAKNFFAHFPLSKAFWKA